MKREANGHDWLPDGACPCIWMSAGLVAYKLCDRDYDCEHCPLDAAMQGVGRPGDGDEQPGLELSPSWEFPDDRQYSSRHAWVRRVRPERLRYGIDVFAARLLGCVTSVVLPTVGSRLRRGTAACWLMEETGPFPLASPVSGTVVRINRRVQRRPELVTDAPYDAGWLLELRPTDRGHALPSLMLAEAVRERADHGLRRIRGEIGRGRGGDIGPTLPDGGERLTDLRRILGGRRYRKLVRSLLCS